MFQFKNLSNNTKKKGAFITYLNIVYLFGSIQILFYYWLESTFMKLTQSCQNLLVSLNDKCLNYNTLAKNSCKQCLQISIN